MKPGPYLFYVVQTQVSEMKVEAVLWFQQLSLLFEAAGIVHRQPTILQRTRGNQFSREQQSIRTNGQKTTTRSLVSLYLFKA